MATVLATAATTTCSARTIDVREKRERIRYVPRKTALIRSDVTGSYTGVPQDDVQPVQDADDL